MALRDECTDTGRLGDARNVIRPEKGNLSLNMAPDTLQDQANNQGYNRIDKPVGGAAPAGCTIGTRD